MYNLLHHCQSELAKLVPYTAQTLFVVAVAANMAAA